MTTPIARKSRRRAYVIAVAVGALLVLFVAYALLVLRTCSEVHGVVRGSYEYRLCGFDRELITKLPTSGLAEEPVFSWRDADGLKPSLRRLRFRSSLPPEVVEQSLHSFLEAAGFKPAETEDDCHWWRSKEGRVCLTIDAEKSDTSVALEVVHVLFE